MPEPVAAESAQPSTPGKAQRAVDDAGNQQPRAGPPNPTIPGHGSPAGEPTPDQVAQWQKAEPGRTATQPAAATQPTAKAVQAGAPSEPAGAGPGSRDTPPPTGEAAAALAKGAKADAPPTVVRPPRPTAAKQEAAGRQHEPPANERQAKLVDAITRRLADNLAKALRQSVVEAVQELDGPTAPAQAAAPKAGPGPPTAR